MERVISKEKLPTFEPCVRQRNRAVSRKYMQAYCDKLYPSGIRPGEKDKLRMMLLASLLNRLVDELGRQLRLHSDNVRARCNTPFAGPTNKMPVHDSDTPEITTTRGRSAAGVLASIYEYIRHN